MKYVKSWKQREFLAEVSGRVAQNMEAACLFVAGEARKRAPVDTGATKRSVAIDVEVSAKGLTIEGRVGVRGGKKGAWYAYFVEMGTKNSGAQPFLRPAVFGNARRIVKILSGGR